MFALLHAALLATLIWPVADSIPAFDIEPYCRAVAARAAPVGDAEVCLRQERQARDQLVEEWAQFPAADQDFCQRLSTTGAPGTYTELLTCLELQRDARNLREREQGTTGQR